jgi:hypothetical protein
MSATPKEIYERAYALHYKSKDHVAATGLYGSLLRDHPKSEEATFARTQLGNLKLTERDIELLVEPDREKREAAEAAERDKQQLAKELHRRRVAASAFLANPPFASTPVAWIVDVHVSESRRPRETAISEAISTVVERAWREHGQDVFVANATFSFENVFFHQDKPDVLLTEGEMLLREIRGGRLQTTSATTVSALFGSGHHVVSCLRITTIATVVRRA